MYKDMMRLHAEAERALFALKIHLLYTTIEKCVYIAMGKNPFTDFTHKHTLTVGRA